MNVFTRGIRNAFRNGIRTLSIVVILGLSIGLSLTMLVAHKAVENKISSVKSSIGNTITIAPAGFNSFSSVNNALTSSELAKVKALQHVTNLDETLTDRLTTAGSSTPSFGFGSQQSSSSTSNQTSLTSPVTLNTSGRGGGRFFFAGGQNGSSTINFSLPITILGTNDPTSSNGTTLTITSGKTIDGSQDTNSALISERMASKNNLKVGSTFTAYSTTLTVAGIFKGSTQATTDTVIVALPTEQRLSSQSGDVTSAVATVDSLDNLSSVTSAIKSTLGSSADVTSAQEQADQTVQPLNSVKAVSLYSLIGAVIAGAIIILLVMIMVVRERKREIGVVKAIGGSNLRIMTEFMVESLTLTILGALIGLIIGVVGGQPVTKALVNNSSTSNTTATTAPTGGVPGQGGGAARVATRGNSGGGFTRGFRNNGAVRGLSNIRAQIGWGILLDGFGAAVFIAVVGSALAAGMIAKVQPSEVLRSA